MSRCESSPTSSSRFDLQGQGRVAQRRARRHAPQQGARGEHQRRASGAGEQLAQSGGTQHRRAPVGVHFGVRRRFGGRKHQRRRELMPRQVRQRQAATERRQITRSLLRDPRCSRRRTRSAAGRARPAPGRSALGRSPRHPTKGVKPRCCKASTAASVNVTTLRSSGSRGRNARSSKSESMGARVLLRADALQRMDQIVAGQERVRA